jgi:hypothetical protein
MEDQVSIFYDGKDLFSGIGPTPLVARNFEPVRYGASFVAKETFTLNGLITGDMGLDDFCKNSYGQLMNKSNTLFNRLNKDFKEFEIKQNGSSLFKKNFARVTSFELDEDKTTIIKPYSITFETFDERYFFESFGVLDQSDEIQYSEGKDGQISITHSVSAVGFKTSISPLQNAINYVNDKCVLGDEIATGRIARNGTIQNPVLASIEEQIDRLQSSYSLVKRYVCDSRAPNSGCVLNFSVETSYDEQSGIYSTSLSGSIQGGLDVDNGNFANMQKIREAFSSLNLYNLANSFFRKKYSLSLNPNMLNLKIDEKEVELSLSFSCYFDSDMGASSVYMDAEYSISYDSLSELHEISASITIKGKKSQKSKWSELKDFYETLNVRGLCQKELSNEGGGALENYPKSHSISFDERNCVITINVSFMERNPRSVWRDFKNLDFNLEANFSKNIILPIQTVYDGAKVVGINCNTRPQVSINGSLNTNRACETSELYSEIKDMSISIIRKYIKNSGQFFIEDIKVTRDLASGQTYNFNATVSFEAGQNDDLFFDLN